MINKYFVLSDVIRGSAFAFVSQKADNFYFYPTNEFSRTWASEQSNNPEGFAENLPPGIAISAPKQLTPKFEYMLETGSFINEEDNVSTDINFSDVAVKFKHAFTYVNSSVSKKQRLADVQIRKLRHENKLNAINYKVLLFIATNKKSSLISNIKSNKLRFDKSQSKFVSSSNSLENIDIVEKSVGRSLERRIGARLSDNLASESRRVNRRVKSLYVKEIAPHALSNREKIDILIQRKAHR